jgi:DNA-binding ferritin-like protein (Dps family)
MNTRAAIAIGLSAIMILGVALASSRNAYAHTFSGDESASFLATVEVIKVQLTLAKNDFATNATLSAEHVEHAGEHLSNDTIKEITERNKRLGTELPASLKELQEALEGGNATAADVNERIANINNLLDETVAVRIEKTQLTNSTVQGTMLADFVDEVLESYNGAYGVEESTNETSMSSNETTQTSAKDNMTSSGEEEGNHTTIVNMMDYESAQALAARAQELFDTKLKALADANATQAVTALDAGLKKLKQAIDDKAALDDVDVIVNSDVHPNIQKAYNLQVLPEFPLPLLLTIPSIAGIIIATRFSALRVK